tara:strand:+ start:1817 stop:3124 length:1308 start_codon:yes stop_codon:yes gene_type:complete
MATFQVQIEDLTGSVSDTAALSSWLTDGARSILNILPLTTLERVVSTDAFTNTIDIEGKKVFSVVRRDDNHSSKAFMPCRKLSSSMMGRVSDTNYMEAASESDPAYIIQGDVLNTYPGSNQSSDSRLTYINMGITVAFGDSAIANFPDEAEAAVVLYATRNGLQRLMNDLHSNSDIDTALTAINAELDETLTIADSMHAEIAKIEAQADLAVTEIEAANAEIDKMAAETGFDNAELDLAKVELAEAAVVVDAKVDTIVANINQASDKCAAAVALANTQFDSAATANAAEDIELSSSHVNAGSGFIGEANAGLMEAQAYSQEAQSVLSQAQSQVNVAQGYIQNGSGYSRVADGYAKAAQGFLGTASGYISAGQGFSATSSGYASEIQTKIGIASGYSQEVQVRLSKDQARYGWYTQQYQMIDGQYKEQLQSLQGAR